MRPEKAVLYRRAVLALTAAAALLLGGYGVAVATAVEPDDELAAVLCGPSVDLLVHPGGTWSCATSTGEPSPSPSTSEPTTAPPTSATPSPSPTGSPSPTASPTPTPSTTSPSPSPSASSTTMRVGCLAAPSACGLPDATNTGVPNGTTLVSWSGSTTITQAGAVIEGRSMGCVTIAAANVVIRKSRITGCFWPVRVVSGSVTIEDSEITCGGTAGSTGIVGRGFTLRRVDISRCENGAHTDGSTTIVDSWIHDLSRSGGDPHIDGVQVGQGAADVLIEHNTIVIPAPGGVGAVNIWNEADPQVRNFVVRGNLLSGGTFTVYCPRRSGSTVTIAGNRFGPHQYGYADACGTSGVTWSSNVDDATGASI